MVAFTKYLHDRIKVKGKTGNLGDDVKIDNTSESSVEVVAKAPFSKRYLKVNQRWEVRGGYNLRNWVSYHHHTWKYWRENMERFEFLTCIITNQYLTKRFLKGQSLRDYIRVIASNTQKNAYELKYFNVHNEEEEENEA
eukprot:1362713-Amorphochlora_amoeboformis.AAC.3